jgi:hypothetical protein
MPFNFFIYPRRLNFINSGEMERFTRLSAAQT